MSFRSLFRSAALLGALAAAVVPRSAHAQETSDAWARWWYGAYAGANINLFSGQLHDLNAGNLNVADTTGFTSGSGIGLALGALIEYNTGDLLGGNLMLGYDNRSVTFDTKNATAAPTTGRSNEQLSASLAYVSVEPNLRINLGSRFFHLLVGPRFGINVAKSYDYKYTDSLGGAVESAADLDNVRSLVLGAQVGLGYDIPLKGPNASTQIC